MRGQVLGGGSSKEKGMMLFGTARANDVRGVTKVIAKHYHFSDSRARE